MDVTWQDVALAAREHLETARRQAQSGAEWPQVPALAPQQRLGVVGAGTMGAGIAQCALAAGLDTWLIDRSDAALARAQARIRQSLDGAVQRGRLTAQERDQRLSRLRAGSDLSALAQADVVIEAVFENLAVKQALLGQLDAACPAHTLLVSNTSTLDIDALAAATSRPAQVLGMHFLTPPHITPLVEVVRGAATGPQALAGARALAQRLGKLPVLTANAWGFIGNRMFEAYLREVDQLQLEGVPAHRIDAALEGYGFALGPCRTLDMAGTDLVSQVLEERGRLFPQPPHYRRITRRLAQLGRFGHKSGRGHYLYEGREHRVDPDLARVCAEEAARLGIAPAPDLDDASIVRRCVEPLVQEGRRVLAEGVAHRAGDIDLVWVLGYGYPASRGGPMFAQAA